MVAYYKMWKTSTTTNNKSRINIFDFKTTNNIGVVNTGLNDKEINPVFSMDGLLIDIKTGIYSHANTTYVNRHTHIESIIEVFTADAILFDTPIGKLSSLHIVHTVYVYDNSQTMYTSLLRFNNANYIKGIDNTLICPNQDRKHGIIVDTIPRYLDHTSNSIFPVIESDTAFILENKEPIV